MCRPDCILSTNTSTIDITLIAKMRQPERIIGAHFFSPAHVMPLLEIVRSSQTPADVTRDLLRYGSQIRKTPVVVGNCTGFAVNRVFFPYTMAAMLLADAGVDAFRIDRVVQRAFGMPIGPFRLTDLVGGREQARRRKLRAELPGEAHGNLAARLLSSTTRSGLGRPRGASGIQGEEEDKAVKDLEAIGPVFQKSAQHAQTHLGCPASSGL